MISLVIISDDFTGALDTGVQFIKYGASVKILTIDKLRDPGFSGESADVLVVDAEIRHSRAEEAYRLTEDIIRWTIRNHVPHVYIKTDSGLRGNIGSELKAALEASGEKFLAFLPAYPELNRITQHGIQYIGQAPIQKSVFGRDPFEPVGSPYLKDLFQGLDVRTENIRISESYQTDFEKPVVGLFDVRTNEDFRRIAAHLQAHGQFHIIAGCAGFASILPEFLSIRPRGKKDRAALNPLLIICGSLSPVTGRQIGYACEQGFARIALTPRQLLSSGYFLSQEGKAWFSSYSELMRGDTPLIIDTGILDPEAMRKYDDAYEGAREINRRKISDALGQLIRLLLASDCFRNRTCMIVGGDTFLAFIRQLQWRYISPVEELKAGTVLALIHMDDREVQVISKSGSFGEKKLLVEISRER